MSLKIGTPIAMVGVTLLVAWILLPWADMTAWAMTWQRSFQNEMASALRAIRAGEADAVWALCSATAAYGLVHAIGPGHGKVLLGGAALASRATLRRLAALTLISSLAQAGTAIVLVGVPVYLLQFSASGAVDVTDTWLAPASHLVISAIGLVLIGRGLKGLDVVWRARTRIKASAHDHDDADSDAHSCSCGHAHGPNLSEVRSLESTRDAMALVVGIAIRPCTGALFVLAIAARFDAFATGCLAVVTMGLGTASFNLFVAGSAAAARGFATLGQASDGNVARQLSAACHLGGGVLIAALGAGMLLVA